ncbi:MAG: type II toxin-antitoxin system HicB family antitoxin [Lactobacillaceae bacterium]|jgi:predicted RNase H-like HicB family nuclease|nr:type II toxin-antitoxin system HicB family antitoxin [Lactobacillaceae bacterium]
MEDYIFVYPAIFEPEDGTINVYFPDVSGALTWGQNEKKAIKYGKEALALGLEHYVEQEEPFPNATPSREVKITGDQYVQLIEVDLTKYMKKHSKSIRKDVTLPSYMATIVKDHGDSLSAILQEAITKKYGL